MPFRSVASRLVRSGAEQMRGLDLDVLRPPTYKRLAQVLRAAQDSGRPYGIVHFDGHGTYLDLTAENDTEPTWVPPPTAGPIRHGSHGYLVFEDPTTASNQQLVDGPSLAALLAETDVPALVLGAALSAYAEAPANIGKNGDATLETIPVEADPTGQNHNSGTSVAIDAPGDVHALVRAYGSLAAEVADAGVPGVVAMRHSVYVVTVTQFVADLYAHILAGKTLGQAATAARKALADDTTRQIGARPVSLED